MTNSEILSAIIEQMIGPITRNELNAIDIMMILGNCVYHIESLQMSCESDGEFLVFVHDLPEKQYEFDTRISKDDAINYFEITLKHIYQEINIKRGCNVN